MVCDSPAISPQVEPHLSATLCCVADQQRLLLEVASRVSSTRPRTSTKPISTFEFAHQSLRARPFVGVMASDADAETTSAPVAVFKRRGAKGKANIRKRPATPPPANSDSDSEYSSSEDEAGHRIKRRKKMATVTASSKNAPARNQDLPATTFTADRSAPISSGNDATKASNWFDENSQDVMSAKGLLGTARHAGQSEGTSDGTYKGLANQTTFIQRRPDAPSKTVGPVKAATNVRTITITDFAPDVCKDYKQTGFVSDHLPEIVTSRVETNYSRCSVGSATIANICTRAKITSKVGNSIRIGRMSVRERRT